MANKLLKMASKNIPHRKQTPITEWFREKFMALNRDPKTPPPGIPGPDGEAVYRPPGRYPSTQTTRSPDQPNIPGGPAHKLATNYYFDRDHRRNVAPPTPIYKPGESAAVDDAEKKSTDGKSYTKGFDKGPSENFGLGDIPTPGVGYVWTRSTDAEEFTQKKSKVMAKLQHYDGYR